MRVKDYDYYYGDCPLELRPLSPWSYVGLTILYAIPVIGWIFLIVFTFHKGNLNRQSFTRSYWCVLLIVLLLLIVIGGIGLVTGKADDVADFVFNIRDSLKNDKTETTSNNTAFNNSITTSGGVTPEFKQMMDSYESFIDEYVAFMNTYDKSTASMEMMTSYTNLMIKYADFTNKIDAVDTNNLPASDYKYYTDVMLRVDQKLLTVANNMG